MSDIMNPNTLPEALRATVQQAMTAPYPVEAAPETKYYYNALPNTCMHRPDGQKLAFVFGICKTNMKYDQLYLDDEIAKGHPHIRLATSEEVHTFNMKINPRETMKQELLADPAVRAQLEDEIRRQLAAQDDASKIAGSDSGLSKLRDGVKSGSGTILPQTSGLTPVSTADISGGAKQSGK